MVERRVRRALVIGGGIGGLATAIVLKQVGIEATVFESAGELREVGAGLTLWTNAVRVLQKLGLAEAFQTIGTSITRGSIRTNKGKVLAETFLDELSRKYGTVTTAVHRADLQAALLRGIGEGAVQAGAQCVGFKEGGTGVEAYFADGRVEQGDFLIGADGIHSVIRAQLFGKAQPRYAGYTSWRGITLFEHPLFPPGATFESWGRGQRFGLVPLNRGRVYWFATFNTPEGRQDGSLGRKRELQRLFSGWHEPIEAVIETTEEAAILHHDIYDRDPLSQWGKGRATLLGDAAHPMTPNMGQGACQAFEDALILAECMQDRPDVVAALRLYEERRIKRTSAIVKRSRYLGQVFQWENPLACLIRNAVMKGIPSRIQLKQLEWVVGYEA